MVQNQHLELVVAAHHLAVECAPCALLEFVLLVLHAGVGQLHGQRLLASELWLVPFLRAIQTIVMGNVVALQVAELTRQ